MREAGYHGNPITGPIYVEGAMPGDTLAVHIDDMECDHLGYFGHWPFEQHLQDVIPGPFTGLTDIRDDGVHYEFDFAGGSHSVRLPVSPMIGTIGTAPEIEIRLSGNTGHHGGNLDSPEICPGSTVYLPVAVAGALLSLGDCHARQGDGELSGVEMRSTITLSATVLKDWTNNQKWIRVETPTQLVTIGCDRPVEDASQAAIREMLGWLTERHGWTIPEARIFLNLVSDLRPGQIIAGIAGLYTMRLRVAKEHLPQL
jgi:amidase